MKNYVALFSIIFLLSGCTPTFNFSPPDVVPVHQKIKADLEYISVVYEGTDPTKPVVILPIENMSKEQQSQEVIPAWAAALHDTLKKSELFDKYAGKKVDLSVRILEIDMPFIAIDITTQVSAIYKLIDTGADKIIYSDTVKSEATVPFRFSAIAYTRAIESFNLAVQNNISTFISRLKSHNFKDSEK